MTLRSQELLKKSRDLMANRFRDLRERLAKSFHWPVIPIRKMRSWLERPKVQGWLANLGASAFIGFVVSYYTGGPRQLNILLFVVGLMCLCLTPSLNWERLRNFVATAFGLIWNNRGVLLLLIFVGGIALRIEYHVLTSKARYPPEIREREVVAEIHYYLSNSNGKRWLAMEEQSEQSKRVFSMREEYELIEAEDPDDPIQKVYIRNGKKIADDARGPLPYAFSRRYYHDGCRFAIDYFDNSQRWVVTGYIDDCKDEPGEFFVNSPVLVPPIPVFTYR